jgi:hypothetical protein
MGKAAVDRAEGENLLREAQTTVGDRREEVKAVGDKTFINRDGAWVDTTYDASEMSPRKIDFGSEDYFDLLAAHPDWGQYFSLGKHLIVVLEGQAYEIVEGELPSME